MNDVYTPHGLVHRRAVIRYTYEDPTDSRKIGSGLITVNFRGKSEESARNFVIRKYPKLKNVQVTELIYI
jgi:hypothetical protein